MLPFVLLAAFGFLSSNAQGISPRAMMSECGGVLCDSAHSHSRSQTNGGPVPTTTSVVLKGSTSPRQSTIIALAIVLSVVVVGAMAFVFWWQWVRRRRHKYAGTQPYIDPDVPPTHVADHGGTIFDAAPPYVPAVDPFPADSEGGNRLQGVAEKRG
ncbi:hypothetical protein B0H16DRAFT_1596503 [Mycena metata]|uniref:Transmembrane protein n=1 Tax=Mycena metata TaxID=1033252 RepID=A0AAD7HNM5_9AGAR|nr:hypothetical protein B0H16DRAFT_1596503 [Mycena metata]